MDRTSAITRLNTEEIINDVNTVIKKGLDKLLGDHLYRYELLEKTHDAIMNLPSVRNHLNLQPLPPCGLKPLPPCGLKPLDQCKSDSVKKEPEVNYSQILEKLLIRIDELTYEVNQLKQARKEIIDLTDEELVVVKLEQKENIKLEIEDVTAEACESDDDEYDEAEEESEEVEDEESVASEEEDDVEEDICSECDCKVILKEDIIIVDGKKYCGACDPSSTNEVEEASVASLEEEEEEEEEEEVEVVASLEEDEVETEKSDSEEEEEITKNKT